MNKPKWLEIAEAEIGEKEVLGEEDNPRIIEYHTTTTLSGDDDEIPWCSSFVNWCMIQAGLKGTDSAAAKSWLKWGKVIDIPELGCICIIKKATGPDQATGSSSGFHVAFWIMETDGLVHLLGGNQSDQVKISRFKKASYSICEYRMPT